MAAVKTADKVTQRKNAKVVTKAAKKETALQKSIRRVRSGIIFEAAYQRANAALAKTKPAKTIAATDIYLRLCSVLDVTHIEMNAPPSDYLKGDDPVKVLRAFAAVLNNSNEFESDGLGLAPGDLGGAKKMKQIGGAIIDWYESNGWIVT
ncbi:hypothetical protein NKH41_27525 [Mesorhizobium sp. M1169]|uniref:hypothetical protein n=1 Tax=Mesorhizobium sp. M1169 TaxID=2957066 RepID=UPI00333DE09D